MSLKNENKIYLLDGSFATQLSNHVNKPIDGDVLWTARFLKTDPEAVLQTHLDYLRAGADIIETNTYQASISGFIQHLYLSEEESYNLIKEAVHIAKEARSRYISETGDRNILIAGSVGPYGASLHDGSEYTGSYATSTSKEMLKDWHRPRVRALVDGGVDLLALETIPCRVEAEALVELIKEFPSIIAWLSFSCKSDGKSTAFGEDFQEAALYCYNSNKKQLIAVGVNCTSPENVELLFTGINENRNNITVPLIAYANSGETYSMEDRDAPKWIKKDQCEPIQNFISKWLDQGVKYIGGCCRVTATEIEIIKSHLRGSTISM